jgi:AIR synthase related protein, N-terminal domain
LTQTSPFPLPLKTHRDVRLFQFTNGQVIVVACDSLGGIGPKPLDKVKVDGYTVGKFTARVALMEVLSVGAKPLCIVDNLCVEPLPTGREILRGVREEAVLAGLDPELAVTGSAEKNFAVEQTGIGITVVGIAKIESLRIGVSQPEDTVVAIGSACMGLEVIKAEQEGKTSNILDLFRLLSIEGVHEIIPVGSEGIKRELYALTKSSGLNFQAQPDSDLHLTKSAGPATVLLASVSPSKLANVEQSFLGKPLRIIGNLG